MFGYYSLLSHSLIPLCRYLAQFKSGFNFAHLSLLSLPFTAILWVVTNTLIPDFTAFHKYSDSWSRFFSPKGREPRGMIVTILFDCVLIC